MPYTTYQAAYRGRYHLINATVTAADPTGTVWTLCGRRFPAGSAGEITNNGPTCTLCRQADNPFNLDDGALFCLRLISQGTPDDMRFLGMPLASLALADYVTPDRELTPRGAILAADFSREPRPLVDQHGRWHTRAPLRWQPWCGDDSLRIRPARQMSTQRYAQLRDRPITCLRCLASPKAPHAII